MKEILENLEKINIWIEESPKSVSFKNNDDFMEYAVQLMNHCLYILKFSVVLAPTSSVAKNGFTKNTAIIVGHLVRITKLYEGFLMHISKRQSELALIFTRLLYEASVRMNYLMKSKTRRKTFRSFIITSYKPEREIISDLEKEATSRSLISIEKRMLRKISSRMKKDKVSKKELLDNKTWNLDGKNFRELLKDLESEWQYAYAFGNGSHFVHGDWCEIDLYHVKEKGRFYTPKLSFTSPDPRVVCGITIYCLKTLINYIKLRKIDHDNALLSTIQGLIEISMKIDYLHEKTLGE